MEDISMFPSESTHAGTPSDSSLPSRYATVPESEIEYCALSQWAYIQTSFMIGTGSALTFKSFKSKGVAQILPFLANIR